jgi:hypothetical protein
MAFGQSSGPPATGKQLNELLELLEAAGHSDFRDARGPMGFTQRQAGGKFTRDEADEFIEQLQSEVYGDGPPADSSPSTRATSRPSKIVQRAEASGSQPKRTPSAKRTPSTKRAAPAKRSAAAKRATPAKGSSSSSSSSSSPSTASLEDVASEDLAAELQRRGWVVLEP